MAKARKKLDNSFRQKSLLEYIQELKQFDKSTTEGTLNIQESLRLALCEDIKECALSRPQIAGEMSHLLGASVTRAMIDSWTAESKPQNRIPAEYLSAWCIVTKSRRSLEIINEAAGAFVLPGPDALRSEIQKWSEKEREARKQKKKRQLFLKEMEGNPDV
jgi:hypothetical protein